MHDGPGDGACTLPVPPVPLVPDEPAAPGLDGLPELPEHPEAARQNTVDVMVIATIADDLMVCALEVMGWQGRREHTGTLHPCLP